MAADAPVSDHLEFLFVREEADQACKHDGLVVDERLTEIFVNSAPTAMGTSYT